MKLSLSSVGQVAIVFGTIGVLAAMAVPNFQCARRRSNVRAAMATKKTIAGALEMYNLDHSTLVVPKGGIANIDKGTLEALKQQGYLQSVPHHTMLTRMKKLPKDGLNEGALGVANLAVRVDRIKSWVGAVTSGAKVALMAPRIYSISPQGDSSVKGNNTELDSQTISVTGDSSNNNNFDSLDLFRKDLTRDQFLAEFGVNPFTRTWDDGLSTFAVDVDTASYTRMRTTVKSGRLPVPEEVRMEEFINYFDYNYKAPEDDVFAVHCEGAPSLFNKGHHLLRVGLKAREVTEEGRKPLALTFVVDCSGSMSANNRLPLVRKSLVKLVERLNVDDKVALVAYGNRAETSLVHTSIKNRNQVIQAINNLSTRGSTNADHGINLGYEVASEGFDKDYVNRVIVCSDGVANMGRTKSKEILQSVKERADLGIYITTLGFGMGRYNDKLMEELADNGNGFYAYIDDLKEAEKMIESNITGGLEVVALDAKIQVKFDRSIVEMYRLIGYENRKVADSDFRNDKVDAGEVSCGHSVTAVYELKLTKAAREHDLSLETLGKVQVRYASPETKEVSEISEAIDGKFIRANFEEAVPSAQLAFVVANYGELLRKSYFAKGHSVKELLDHVKRIETLYDLSDEVTELKDLMVMADSKVRMTATD